MPDDQGALPNAAPPPATRAAGAPNNTRRNLFSLLGAAVVIAALGGIGYWYLIGINSVSTDDAYVGAEVAQITPQIAGQVAEVRVEDAAFVHRGDILVVIDPADQKLVLAQAQAEYDRAVRRIRQDLALNDAAAASVTAREADLDHAQAAYAAAQSNLDRAKADLQRRKSLTSSGAVSAEEYTIAHDAWQTAAANLDAARAVIAQAQAARVVAQAQLRSGQALTEGADIESNPEVAAARAALDSARLDLSRTILRAPFDGVIAQRRVQIGQRVAIGAQLMSVVPVNALYVDANYKESQLGRVRTGQPATLISDRYGSAVIFHGRVAGIGGGTGAAFALIPAQNATGNWIKVVQRLPVRIALDPAELARHPLRVGLSMDVTIDVRSADQAPAEGVSHMSGGG